MDEPMPPARGATRSCASTNECVAVADRHQIATSVCASSAIARRMWNDSLLICLTAMTALATFIFRTGELSDLATLSDIDNDAGRLFEQAGLDLDLPEDHEFFTTEKRRWKEALMAGTTVLALDPTHAPIGFIALGTRDGMTFVEQLSVRLQFMRRGLGSTLLDTAAEIARTRGPRSLWLTTYGHLPFNRPYYERQGFTLVPRSACGPQLLETADFERRCLPVPHERVVMRREV